MRRTPTHSTHAPEPFVQWLAARHFDQALEVFGSLHEAAHTAGNPHVATLLRRVARELLDDASVLAFLASNHRRGTHPSAGLSPSDHEPAPGEPAPPPRLLASDVDDAVEDLASYVQALRASASVLGRRTSEAQVTFDRLSTTATARLSTVADRAAA